MTAKNVMQTIRVEKVTLNIGAGADPEKVKKAVALLSTISNMKPVETKAKKRIAAWKIRPGLPIGSKVTLRKKRAVDLLKLLLEAVDNKLRESCFTANGFSFGIPEYINIPGVKYDPNIGIIGLNVCVTLERPGFAVKKRKLYSTRISRSHQISKEEAIKFAKEKLGVVIEK